jgi:predicted alpha/beta superfamily hydrolase/tetratricopeptide (TPR) repeat protein
VQLFTQETGPRARHCTFFILMSHFVGTVIFIFGFVAASGQSISFETFKSEALQQERKLRVALPESYAKETSKRYPVLVVLDGEYMFSSALGATVISAAYDVIPEVIVVAIDQNYVMAGARTARWTDGAYDDQAGELRESGRKFKAFLSDELLPHVDRAYRTTPFRVIAGHSFTASFLHFFLRDERPAFHGYLAISPYVPRGLHGFVGEKAQKTPEHIFYFASTGKDDLSGHLSALVEVDSVVLSKVTNPRFHYRFENYPDVNHRSVVNRSMETALLHVFSLYGPMAAEESKSEPFLADPAGYLDARRGLGEKLYGVKVNVRAADLMKAREALIERQDWTGLRRAGELALSVLGASPLGPLMLGRHFEEAGQAKAAIDEYQRALEKLPPNASERADLKSRINVLTQKLPPAERADIEAIAKRREAIVAELKELGISTLPRSAGVLNSRGYRVLYGATADPEVAVKLFRLNLELFPTDNHVADLYDSLAEGYLQAGDLTAAIDAYEKALSLDPKHPHAARFMTSLRTDPKSSTSLQQELKAAYQAASQPK